MTTQGLVRSLITTVLVLAALSTTADGNGEKVAITDSLGYKLEIKAKEFRATSPGVTLAVGDRVVLTRARKQPVTTFHHRCFKESTEEWWWGDPADTQTTPAEYKWHIVYDARFKPTRGKAIDFRIEGAGEEVTLHFVAPSDGRLTLRTVPWDPTQYNVAKTDSPCAEGYQHQGLIGDEPPLPDTRLKLYVCRSGVVKVTVKECAL